MTEVFRVTGTLVVGAVNDSFPIPPETEDAAFKVLKSMEGSTFAGARVLFADGASGLLPHKPGGVRLHAVAQRVYLTLEGPRPATLHHRYKVSPHSVFLPHFVDPLTGRVVLIYPVAVTDSALEAEG